MTGSHILALDTAMGGCAVGVVDAQTGKTLSSLHEIMTAGQAERLVPMIEQALKEADADYPDLAAIAVTRGPGAFTGLRIGLATARALAMTLKIPAIGVETFDALIKTSGQMKKIETPAAVLIETKRSDYYIRMYDRTGNPAMPGASWSLEKMLEELENYADCLLIGDAVQRFIGESGKKASWQTLDIWTCAPAAIASCARNKMSVSPCESRTLDTDPLYLRAPDVTLPKKTVI